MLEQRCVETFGERFWCLLAETLDKMPFAVLIDEVIFCAHSGVPKSNRLALLLDIPPILRKVEDCPIAFEVRMLNTNILIALGTF